jgi:hypothetical protein
MTPTTGALFMPIYIRGDVVNDIVGAVGRAGSHAGGHIIEIQRMPHLPRYNVVGA